MKAARARRKKLLLAVVLASLACLGGCVALIFQDEPPPDDSDLVLVRREVPAHENGFLALDFIPDDIYWPDDDERLRAESDDFDIEGAREVVERNASILAKLEECLHRPEFQVSEQESSVPYLLAWRALTFVVACQSVYLCEIGRPAEGLRCALRLLAFGKRCQESQAPLIGYLVGIAVSSVARKAVLRCSSYPGLDAAELRAAVEQIPRLRAGPDAFPDAVRGEYLVFKAVLRGFEAGEDVGVRGSPGFRPFYYRQRTLRLCLDGFRAVLRDASKRPGDRDDVAALSTRSPPWWLLTRYLNRTGRALVEDSLSSGLGGLRETDQLAVELAALEALLALRAHHFDSGKLPASLAELVPVYLKAVPLDPFDGKPLRYSPEDRIVYSIGRDLQDSGGAADTDAEKASDNRDEPTFAIEF